MSDARSTGDNRPTTSGSPGGSHGGSPGGSAGTGDAVRLVRELTRLGAHLQHVTSRHTGLSPADLSALAMLVDDVIGPAELARRLGLTTAAATGIVDRLEARGFVERRPTPGDRRRTGVHITHEGRTRHTDLLRPMVQRLFDLEASLDPDDRAAVVAFLAGATEVIAEEIDGLGTT